MLHFILTWIIIVGAVLKASRSIASIHILFHGLPSWKKMQQRQLRIVYCINSRQNIPPPNHKTFATTLKKLLTLGYSILLTENQNDVTTLLQQCDSWLPTGMLSENFGEKKSILHKDLPHMKLPSPGDILLFNERDSKET